MYARVAAVAVVEVGTDALRKSASPRAAARPMSDKPNIIMGEGFMNH